MAYIIDNAYALRVLILLLENCLTKRPIVFGDAWHQQLLAPGTPFLDLFYGAFNDY